MPKEQVAQVRTPEEGVGESVNTEEKKSGFPVVPVTALLLVGLAIGFYLWSRSQFNSNEEEVEAPVVVRKDSVKKDTINIMRNENAKSKVNDDLFKLPEAQKTDEQKKPEAEQKRPETERVPEVTTENGAENNPAATDPSAATAVPASPAATPPATPSTPTTQPAAGPPADNPAPSTVEPKPVIPEE